LASRRNRPGRPRGPEPAIEVKTAASEPAASEAPVSKKIIYSILGGFAALSLLYLAISWPGYQIERRTVIAERALNEERYADALPHLEYIVKRYPGAWVRLTQLGDCYLELGNPQKALDLYEQSLAKEPEQGLYARRGRAHYLINPRSNEAIELLQKAYDADPNDSEVNYYMGLFYMNQRDYANAAGRFQAAAGDPKIFQRVKPELEKIEKHLLGDPAADRP
jgi:tetratricopeptide (TPR) repeat protein